MNSKLKTALIVLAIMLIPVAGYFTLRALTRKKQEDGSLLSADDSADNGASSASQGGQNGLVSNNANFPLKMNASVKSDLVKQAQQGLNAKIKGIQPPTCPYYNGKAITELEIDGYYGPKTAAVVKFLYPDTDGNSITEEMYNELVTANSMYILFY